MTAAGTRLVAASTPPYLAFLLLNALCLLQRRNDTVQSWPAILQAWQCPLLLLLLPLLPALPLARVWSTLLLLLLLLLLRVTAGAGLAIAGLIPHHPAAPPPLCKAPLQLAALLLLLL
jgi:hypothetical protein